MKPTIALVALALATTALTPAKAATFQVPYGVELGYMNIRTGPGMNYPIIGRIPAGATLTGTPPLECRPREDFRPGPDFCHIRFNGVVGWVSQIGLVPVVEEPRPLPAPVVQPVVGVGGLTCDQAVVLIGDDRDSNPVIKTEVSYNPDSHAWRIFHTMANGQMVSRGEQYALTDWSADGHTRWTGSLNRNRSLVMVGEVGRNGNGLVYDEWLYDRGQGGRLDMHMTFAVPLHRISASCCRSGLDDSQAQARARWWFIDGTATSTVSAERPRSTEQPDRYHADAEHHHQQLPGVEG